MIHDGVTFNNRRDLKRAIESFQLFDAKQRCKYAAKASQDDLAQRTSSVRLIESKPRMTPKQFQKWRLERRKMDQRRVQLARRGAK